MKSKPLTSALAMLTTVALVGCIESEPDVFDGSAISLSSLREAGKRIDEAEKILDRADQLNLPLIVDESLWELQPGRPTPRLASTNLSRAIPAKVDIWGLAVAPQAGRALVTYVDETKDRRSRDTAGAYCDLESGRVLSTFDLPEFAAPYAIDPTGKYAILCRRDGIRSGRETLYVAELDRKQVTLRQWRPLVDPLLDKPKPFVEEDEIMWATFVGSNRIVTVNNAKTLHIWSFPERKRLGSFACVDGIPALTPDRKLVVLASGDTLALLDPTIPAVVGYRRFGPPPKDPVVAVDPRGKRIAIGGQDEAMIIDLEQGGYYRVSYQHLSADPGPKLIADFAFVGPFLHSSRQLYDLDSPRAVWSIDNTQWERPLGDDYWAVVWHDTNGARRGGRQLVLRPFKIPHGDIEKRIADVYRTSDVLALQRGDSVRLDVSGIPADRRAEVRDALHDELTNQGFFPANSAVVTVKAFVDPEKEFKSTYIKSKSVVPTFYSDDIPKDRIREIVYRGRHARLWITKNGRRLWSREGIERPASWLSEDDVPENGRIDFYGEPKYSIFTEPGFPDFIAGDYNGVLGSTTLSAGGMKSHTREPKRRRK